MKNESTTRPATPWDPNSPVNTYQYTSGDLWSLQKFGWGKYEIRCKIPKGNNFWSGFSTYGEKNGVGNEIDIFEFSNSYKLSGNIDKDELCKLLEMHYHRWDKTQSVAGIDHNCGNYTGSSHGTDYSEDFHIFTIVWDRWAISWYVDGRLIKKVAQWYDLMGKEITRENIKPMQVVLRNDWFPTLEMTMGFGLNIKDDNDFADEQTFPATLLVDYVRYYKKY
jgi:beta-glucanase (GH16 family)